MPKITFKSDWLKANENTRSGDLIKFLDAGRPDDKGQWIFKVAVIRGGSELYTKKFGLNRKNFKAIADVHGDNSDAWIGKEMEVRIVDVDSPQGIVAAVRLVAPGTAASGEDEEDETGF